MSKLFFAALSVFVALYLVAVSLDAQSPRLSTSQQSVTTSSSTNAIAPASSKPPSAPQSVVHGIDQVSVEPFAIVKAPTQSITVTASISDPTVISTGVNLLQVSANGNKAVIGVMHDDGLNGDLVAGDGTYTLVVPSGNFSVGTVSFVISAAFRGALSRVQSEVFTVSVLPPTNTSTWSTLVDPGGAFTIRVPATWNVSMIPNSDPNDYPVRQVNFQFADGTIIFIIGVYTPNGWLQQQNETAPGYLGSSNAYVFGVSVSEAEFPTEQGLSDDQIRTLLPQILATFHAN